MKILQNNNMLITGLLIIILTAGCMNLRPCNKDITGIYYTYNNPTAENYLILTKDSTFYHYYKNEQQKLMDSGKWNFNKKYCYIEFNQWKNFNEKGTDYEEFGNYILFVNGKYLDIGPDGESSKSFIKKTKTDEKHKD